MNIEIRLTDNTAEMIDMAKSIVRKNPQKYTSAVLESITQIVREYLPDQESEAINEMVYKTIYYYWVYGCSTNEFFYYHFEEKSYDEIKEYITLHEKVLFSLHLDNYNDAHLLNNKYETYELLKEYYLRDVIICKSDDDYDVFREFAEKHPIFVVKPSELDNAHGVHKDDLTGLNEKQLKCYYKNLLLEGQNNNAKFLRNVQPAVVLEEVINQAPELAAFNSASANGVRITTVKLGSEIIIYHPWFKVGRAGEFITSAIYGTLDAGIDPQNGIIVTAGYSEHGEICKVHPDSNLQILGFQIPRWNEAVELAKTAALTFPSITSIGWDLVLTPAGWCIMEGNYRGDCMWQLFEEKGSKKEFEELVGWKLAKEYWWK